MLDCNSKFSYTQYMLTLSDASRETKTILKWGGLILALVVLIAVVIRGGLYVKELVAPTPPPEASISFGKLQQQSFPTNVTDSKFTYSVNTLTGALPTFPNISKVYRMKQTQPDLLGLNKARTRVGSAGFLEAANPITDRVFEWSSNPELPGIPRKIRLNIVNNDFTVSSDYMNNPAILSAKGLPNKEQSIIIAEGFLGLMNLLPEDVDTSKTSINLFSIRSNTLVPATSLSNAQIVEVNYYQKDIDKLKIYYEKPNSSNISILIGSTDQQAQVVAASYVHQEVSNESSTYPIKTGQEAFEELKAGNGYIASYLGSSSNISIKNVSLGYYIGTRVQDFLMPIIIFEADNGFAAYVPAVRDESIDK